MENEGRTVWCGNLSERATHPVVRELFLHAGPIEKVYIPKDRDGRQRNYAFITYVHEESVLYALNIFKGTFLWDKQLNLQSKGASRLPDKNLSLRDEDREPVNCGMSPRYDESPYSSSLKQKFGLPPQNLPPMDSYVNNHFSNMRSDLNRPSIKDLSIASLTGQWSSKNIPVERFEPYRRDSKNNKYKEIENNHGRNTYNDKGNNEYRHYRDHNINNQQRQTERNHRKHSRH
ncbi:uncharacterized protein LOC143911189 [Arctopsyche grandis]|uniref:uncharacterized protein LOC143911189 n=1 Tax=Arctopsyche grandis TaxID=121162 RepID=UPI00406D9B3A